MFRMALSPLPGAAAGLQPVVMHCRSFQPPPETQAAPNLPHAAASLQLVVMHCCGFQPPRNAGVAKLTCSHIRRHAYFLRAPLGAKYW
jgi:hypothetical protein